MAPTWNAVVAAASVTPPATGKGARSSASPAPTSVSTAAVKSPTRRRGEHPLGGDVLLRTHDKPGGAVGKVEERQRGEPGGHREPGGDVAVPGASEDRHGEGQAHEALDPEAG